MIDTPTVGSFYGAAVSAPVFHEVAQEVLEYLGVPHDQAVQSQKQMEMARKDDAVDDAPDQSADLTAMFDDVNSLPTDDPLRQPATAAAMAANQQADKDVEAAAVQAAAAKKASQSALSQLTERALAELHAGGARSAMNAGEEAKVVAPVVPPAVQARGNGAVVVDGGKRVAVPEFGGAALRSVVENADRLGLRVQTLGSGLAREQAPVAGTMVPLGTEVVVRFTR